MDFAASQDMDILFVGVEQMEINLVLQLFNAKIKARFADTLEQATTLLSDTPVKLVICEAERRGLDIRKLCSEQEIASCIFLSSRDRDLEKRKCLLKVAECYLTRPYTARQLHTAATIAQGNHPIH